MSKGLHVVGSLSYHVADLHALVLATILDKLGHPSSDDPFNPDIAAVSLN